MESGWLESPLVSRNQSVSLEIRKSGIVTVAFISGILDHGSKVPEDAPTAIVVDDMTLLSVFILNVDGLESEVLRLVARRLICSINDGTNVILWPIVNVDLDRQD